VAAVRIRTAVSRTAKLRGFMAPPSVFLVLL
jgi:hypothetical protein